MRINCFASIAALRHIQSSSIDPFCRRTNQGCDDDSDDEKRFETGQVGNTKYVKDNETGNYAYGKTETGHHKGEHGAVAGKQTKYGVKVSCAFS